MYDCPSAETSDGVYASIPGFRAEPVSLQSNEYKAVYDYVSQVRLLALMYQPLTTWCLSDFPFSTLKKICWNVSLCPSGRGWAVFICWGRSGGHRGRGGWLVDSAEERLIWTGPRFLPCQRMSSSDFVVGLKDEVFPHPIFYTCHVLSKNTSHFDHIWCSEFFSIRHSYNIVLKEWWVIYWHGWKWSVFILPPHHHHHHHYCEEITIPRTGAE